MSMQLIFTLFLLVTALFLVRAIRASRRRGGKATRGHASNSEVYVGNLNYRTDEQELTQHFAQYGKINEVKIIKNNRTGRSKGYAFIRYGSANEAEKALSSHGAEFNSRALVVRIAKSQAH